MLELNMQTMAMDAEAPPEDALENGAKPIVHCQVVGAQELPLANPNTGRPLRYPAYAVNFGLTKEAALQWSEKLKEEAEKLPDATPSSSKLITATSMAEAERVADLDKKIR